MANLNEEILKLKIEGKSFRQIAYALGISHEAVRKRLKHLEGNNQMSTRKLAHEFMILNPCKGNQLINSEKEIRIVNKKYPYSILPQGVNYLENPSGKATIGKKGVSQKGFLGIDGLFEAIKGFLEYYGIKFYRLQCEPEAYQIKHGGQIIRFYVQRKIGVDKAKEEME